MITRFEKKWVFENTDINFLKIAIFRSDLILQEAFPNRNVNSIYFDDNKLSSVYENLDGISNKKKYRVRWYGNSNIINDAKLEIKSKKGIFTSKKVMDLGINKNLEYNNQNLNKIEKKVNEILSKRKYLEPILSTHYKRFYYLSSNQKIRVTLDTNLQSSFLKIRMGKRFKKNYNKKILELKYDKKFDFFVQKKIEKISARMSKNSKYINSFFDRSSYTST